MIQKIIGGILLAIGALGLAIEIEDIIAGTSTEPVFGLTLGALFAAGGAALLVSAARARRRAIGSGGAASQHQLEPQLLRLAQERGGRLSAVEASASLGTPFEETRKLLEALTSQGACQVLVTEEGGVVYRFPDLEPGAAKRDLLEGGARSD